MYNQSFCIDQPMVKTMAENQQQQISGAWTTLLGHHGPQLSGPQPSVPISSSISTHLCQYLVSDCIVFLD